VERISSIFKRPVQVSPEDLGAALFELTTESLQDLLSRVVKEPLSMGGIERETFFAEAIALQMFAVGQALGERVPDAAIRARTLGAFRDRYVVFRGVFHGRTLTPAEADQRFAVYAEVARAQSNHLLPLGSQFVKLCGHLSPMGATTATAFYHEHHQATVKILDKAEIVG